ncbi:MAG: hypothetical protein KatS3mg096_146 [Candidatus Parcubacteria bacterium]|nr:MAG: hypothetical protein KatS3mg096_146 [Candidatus Parcubacteria bacterium]
MARLILSLFLFKEYLRKEHGFSFLYLILSILIFLGYYSSFVFIFLIVLEVIVLIKKIIFDKVKLFDLEYLFLRIALAIVYLFVGPGLLSLDRMFNIRF